MTRSIIPPGVDLQGVSQDFFDAAMSALVSLHGTRAMSEDHARQFLDALGNAEALYNVGALAFPPKPEPSPMTAVTVYSALQLDATEAAPVVRMVPGAYIVSPEALTDWLQVSGWDADSLIGLDEEKVSQALHGGDPRSAAFKAALAHEHTLLDAVFAWSPNARPIFYGMPFTLSSPINALSPSDRAKHWHAAMGLKPLLHRCYAIGVSCYDYWPGNQEDPRFDDTIKLASALELDKSTLCWVRHRYVEATPWGYQQIPQGEVLALRARLLAAGASAVIHWGGDWSDFFGAWTQPLKPQTTWVRRRAAMQQDLGHEIKPRPLPDASPEEHAEWQATIQEWYQYLQTVYTRVLAT